MFYSPKAAPTQKRRDEVRFHKYAKRKGDSLGTIGLSSSIMRDAIDVEAFRLCIDEREDMLYFVPASIGEDGSVRVFPSGKKHGHRFLSAGKLMLWIESAGYIVGDHVFHADWTSLPQRLIDASCSVVTKCIRINLRNGEKISTYKRGKKEEAA